MRYGIFSDVHANLEALEVVLDAYRKESIDKYLCVGDVVGYAANPKECIDKVREIAVITVAGNHDWAAVNLFSVDYFNPVARQAIMWTRRILDDSSKYYLETLKLIYKNEDLTLVHGTLNNPGDFDYMISLDLAKEAFEILETNVCFIGHTHVPGVFIRYRDEEIKYYYTDNMHIEDDDNKYIVNVGSVGQPRDGNPKAAYCIYDTQEKQILIKRTDYPIEIARKKIFDAGLPRFLGNRILAGS